MIKRPKLYIVASLILVLVALAFAKPSPVHAISITVNSPANGQTFSGNDFTVSGVADVNTSIIVLRNGLTIAQTRSDSSGNWSVGLHGLPDGDNSITVRSIKNTGFGYFIAGNQSSQAINALRLTDNAINPNSPFPITDTGGHVLMVPSPTENIFYAGGNFSNQNNKPAKFNNNSPSDPVDVSGNYPANASINIGAFSADGTKYYSPNDGLTSVSVIDVASNSWTQDIDLGTTPITALRSPSNKLYVTTRSNSVPKISVIDTASNTIVKTVDVDQACNSGQVAPTVTFSQDSAYPYYFVPCLDSGNPGNNKVLKYNLATDALVSEFAVQVPITSAVLNADNTKLYMSSTMLLGNNPDADKTFVLDASTGALLKTITMHAGVIGIFPSPDLQHIYAATPGDFTNNNPSTGIDILDMLTDEVTHISTNDTALAITAPYSSVTLSNVNVSVVLGVKTTTGQLAKTGAFIAVASPIGLFFIFGAFYTFWDYRRHRAPLLAADPSASYSYWHHLKVVSVPLVKYRLSISVDKNLPGRSDQIDRF